MSNFKNNSGSDNFGFSDKNILLVSRGIEVKTTTNFLSILDKNKQERLNLIEDVPVMNGRLLAR